MSTTPEGRVKAKISILLRQTKDLWYTTPIGNIGIPALDYIGVYKGHFFAIEAKKKGGQPTPRQLYTIDQIRTAGGTVFVIDDTESLALFSEWIRQQPCSSARSITL